MKCENAEGLDLGEVFSYSGVYTDTLFWYNIL